MNYGEIIFLLNIIFLLPNVTASIFRAEGDVKRATNPLILTAILNIIIDPIFIYSLDLGMALSNFLWVVVLDCDFFVQDIAFVPSYSHVS